MKILEDEEESGRLGHVAQQADDRLVEPKLGRGRFARITRQALDVELRQELPELATGRRPKLRLQ